MAFLTASGLVKTYLVGQTRLTVLQDLDLSVEAGEMVAIVGASGVGKSTLLHLLGGLDRVDGGAITIGDHTITSLSDAEVVRFRNRHVGELPNSRAGNGRPGPRECDELFQRELCRH